MTWENEHHVRRTEGPARRRPGHPQGEGLFKAEAVITTPQSAEIGVGDRRVLNLCANNYLGLADHPAMIEPPSRPSTAGGSGWPRCASSAAPPRSTRSWRPARRLPRHRRRDPLRLLLRRQRRPVRDPARAGGRGDLRRPQPREHHRRRTPVQGPAIPVRQPRHGRPRVRLEQAERPDPPDRHRRGVLDGRLRRPAGRDRRSRRALRRAGDGR